MVYVSCFSHISHRVYGFISLLGIWIVLKKSLMGYRPSKRGQWLSSRITQTSRDTYLFHHIMCSNSLWFFMFFKIANLLLLKLSYIIRVIGENVYQFPMFLRKSSIVNIYHCFINLQKS